MEGEHIVKSFDQELGEIESLIVEMGGMLEAQIANSIEALIARDTDMAEQVQREDDKVDALEEKIDELTVILIARRQPMASDLRSAICALKAASMLERIGDYSKNISKRSMVVADFESIGSSMNTIKRMGRMVQKMVHDVIDAYMSRDVKMSEDLRARDEEVDHMHNTLFRELLTHMMEDARNITPCMHLLFIAKNLERMGDHVTGIAEQIYFLETGVMPEDERPKSDLTSIMDEDGVADTEDGEQGD